MFLEDLWPPLDRLANPAANPTEVQVIVPPPPPWASSSFSSSFSHGGALSLWVALALLLAYVRRRTEKGPFFPSLSSFQTLRERERERERERAGKGERDEFWRTERCVPAVVNYTHLLRLRLRLAADRGRRISSSSLTYTLRYTTYIEIVFGAVS